MCIQLSRDLRERSTCWKHPQFHLQHHRVKMQVAETTCESGGIGRRTRLRIWRVKPWGFESPLSHQYFRGRLGIGPFSIVSTQRFTVPTFLPLEDAPIGIYLLFFISGIPAILYQIVWQRALFSLYGINIESVTIVIS